MPDCKLVFIEGIPGSGKSTAAQFIAHTFGSRNIPHKWWYEEEKGHPVYLFEDNESLRHVIENLSNGNYRQVVSKALARWEAFSKYVRESDEIIIVDRCLFPNNVPLAEIADYVAEVERIVSKCNPALIYLVQLDIAAALQKICARRGGHTESHFIRAATESAYGKTHCLTGFHGLVSYWEHYREFTDELFRRVRFPKLSIHNEEGDWPRYDEEMLQFLGIDKKTEVIAAQEQWHRYAGHYRSEEYKRLVCSIVIAGGRLVADGLPKVWPRTALLPRSSTVFDLESLPLQVAFEEDESGMLRMHVSGSPLLDGPVDMIFTKDAADHPDA